MPTDVVPGDVFASPWGRTERVIVIEPKSRWQTKTQYTRLHAKTGDSCYLKTREDFEHQSWTYIGNVNNPDDLATDKFVHEASRERLREYMNPYHPEDGDPLPAIDPPQTNKDMRRLHGTELLEEFQNDWGGSDDIDDLIENKWAVVTQRGDDGEGWVNGANTLDEIARLIMAVHTAEYYVEWVEGIYDLDTGKNADITSSQVLTVSVHDNNGDSTELTSDI